VYLLNGAAREAIGLSRRDCVASARSRATVRKGLPIDTSIAAGKCFLDMLGAFAGFETNLRRERQLKGIAKAKSVGVYTPRQITIRSRPSRLPSPRSSTGCGLRRNALGGDVRFGPVGPPF
jgi:hypothetical protein